MVAVSAGCEYMSGSGVVSSACVWCVGERCMWSV